MSSLKKGNVENYWANSGSANTIRECLKRCSRDIEIQLQNLFYTFYSLQDDDSLQRLVEMELKPHLRYDVLEKELEIDAIYTLLCYSGYLTVKTYSTDVELIVPNKQWGSTK
ncbi:10445_t:CDS:1, partial [Paraglomus brasilianum]